MNKNKHLGDTGERVVEEWLKSNGFTILARNFRSKSGEVDLIAKKYEVVAFVEVKTRINEYFATSMVVNKTKQRKIIKTAELFVLTNKLRDLVFRFDVATVTFDTGKPQVTYIPNAFSL